MPTRNTAHEALVATILKEFGALSYLRIWENKTGMAYRKKRPIWYGLVGSGDILGILKGGTFLSIEVKTGKARQTAQQIAFEKMITKFGGLYIVARSTQDVKKALDLWSKAVV